MTWMLPLQLRDYAVTENDDLLWYRHNGRGEMAPSDGAAPAGKRIGTGWTFKDIF